VAAVAQEHDRRLVADLHPGAGDQRDAPAEVDLRMTLGRVLVAARRTELIVEEVEAIVGGLADVAGALVDRRGGRGGRCLRKLGASGGRRQRQRRGEDRLAALGADAGLLEGLLAGLTFGRPALSTQRLVQRTALLHRGTG
jgi:hypothetical protein